ncbi:hypothetical protein [Streptomyces sp. NPDC054865]
MKLTDAFSATPFLTGQVIRSVLGSSARWYVIATDPEGGQYRAGMGSDVLAPRLEGILLVSRVDRFMQVDEKRELLADVENDVSRAIGFSFADGSTLLLIPGA